jgi:4-hydroxy-3-methylbut-2-enyl diphosphate reductase IspH
MGLNLSNEQIFAELGLSVGDVQEMTMQLREGIVVKKPVQLKGEIETDEVYITTGHKGHPELVARLGRKGRRRKLRGKRRRGMLAEEKRQDFASLAVNYSCISLKLLKSLM